MFNYAQYYTNANKIFCSPSKRRFLETAKIVSEDVLDAGCGRGELKKYLQNCQYTAFDGTPWVAEVAKVPCMDIMDYKQQHKWVVAIGLTETCNDLQALADQIKKLCLVGAVIGFSTTSGAPFITHTYLEMTTAFGPLEFIPVEREGEVLAILRK